MKRYLADRTGLCTPSFTSTIPWRGNTWNVQSDMFYIKYTCIITAKHCIYSNCIQYQLYNVGIIDFCRIFILYIVQKYIVYSISWFSDVWNFRSDVQYIYITPGNGIVLMKPRLVPIGWRKSTLVRRARLLNIQTDADDFSWYIAASFNIAFARQLLGSRILNRATGTAKFHALNMHADPPVNIIATQRSL